jgi:hypothetical protein
MLVPAKPGSELYLGFRGRVETATGHNHAGTQYVIKQTDPGYSISLSVVASIWPLERADDLNPTTWPGHSLACST